jgi:hypothetical protein
MALLSDNEIKEVIRQTASMEIRESRRQVPYWLMRGLCVIIGAAFWLLCLLLLLGSNPVWIVFLLLGTCWLEAAVIFHLVWRRYAEATIWKKHAMAAETSGSGDDA